MTSTIPTSKTKTPLQTLVDRKEIPIAVSVISPDDETLMIQVATRIDRDRVAVKCYKQSDIPVPPEGFDLAGVVAERLEFLKEAILRPIGDFSESISPVCMLCELFRLSNLRSVSRSEGIRLIEGPSAERPPNAFRENEESPWEVPTIGVVLVAHDLNVCFSNTFGRNFYDEVLRPSPGTCKPLDFRSGKVLGFAPSATSWVYRPPVVEFVQDLSTRCLFQVTLDTVDTALPFGKGKLDDHARTFLRLPQSTTTRTCLPKKFYRGDAEAYEAGAVRAIDTMLIHEEMIKIDRGLYEPLGVDQTKLPPFRRTLGKRVSDFITKNIECSVADSLQLDSPVKVKRLMREGGARSYAEGPTASRFGEQTCGVHGGLTFSRSPTRFWHEAPGMLRDVDMSECYATILSSMNVYWGRPFILEPGSEQWNLLRAVEFLSQNADEDAWFVRVTGDMGDLDNALILSTVDAITSNNLHRKRKTKGEKHQARLFSRRIESGIVTSDTWKIIQFLPRAHRSAYERLTAETLVVYPRKFAAVAESFDEVVAQFEESKLPWADTLDLDARIHTTKETLDHRYVTLKYPFGELMCKLRDLRAQARADHGKGSGAEAAYKLQVNSAFGILGSRHLATFNPVAANIVTASARARSFALFMSLNGIQVITDGCTYRKDQIPACTLAECLEICPDYLLRRAEAEDGIPFLDPAQIPDEPSEFKRWNAQHARMFFGFEDEPPHDLFSGHDLEHKEEKDTVAFDALSCDGGSNYIKWTLSQDGIPQSVGMAMRGYGRESQQSIKDWILESYRDGRVNSPPPLTKEERTLRLADAKSVAREAIKGGAKSVLLPLGRSQTRVNSYQALKLSAFVCQNPHQYRLLARHLSRFSERTGCGVEILALHEKSKRGPTRRLVNIAESVYNHIRSGRRDFAKRLHLGRLSESIECAARFHKSHRQRLRDKARDRLHETYQLNDDERSESPLGVHYTAEDYDRLAKLNTDIARRS